MIAPLFNASSIPLGAQATGLPDVSGALLGWFRPLTFTRIVKTTRSFRVVEERVAVAAEGMVVPFNTQQLMVKPEGQRAWKWRTIFATPALQLSNDDVVTQQNPDGTTTSYRVMMKKDFSAHGYLTYDVVEDYQELP
jgi:hypothetical protein